MRVIKEGISAEQLFNEYEGEKKIVNGVYCKVVFGTYEAINPIPPVVEYEEGELEALEQQEHEGE